MAVFAYWCQDSLLEAGVSPNWPIEVTQVYHDRTLSQVKLTTSRSDRTQWQQLLQACQTQPPEQIILRRLDDLGTSVQEVRDRLAELNVLTIPITVLEQPAPTGYALEAWQYTQQIYQAQRSRRIQQGHARNRVNALPPPGKPPYGYRRGQRGYVVDRTTAPVVKEFFEQFLLFGSLRGAVRHLAKKYNKKIAVSTGHRWLTNPVYRGDLAYQDGKIVRDTHMPIISREEAAQVDRLLRRNRRLPPRSASAPRSLAGLVVCAQCQSPMTITNVTTPRSDLTYLYLRPRQCPQQPKCRTIAYEQVFQATIERICADLPVALAEVNPNIGAAKQGIVGAIAAQQAILDQLPNLVVEGILDEETAALRAYTLRTDLANLQSQLDQLPPANLVAIAQTVSLPQFWLDLSEAECRFYFREFIRRIELVHNETGWSIKLVFPF
jgi:DNA invertase Pin-like site-specific DNA recombinase